MADFYKALHEVLLHEGKYVNDKSDPGGETYCGVARKMWPNWEGWAIVDSYRSSKLFPSILDRDDKLQKLIETFYRNNFWMAVDGTVIENQDVAECIFDFAVNAGCGTAKSLANLACGSEKYCVSEINKTDPQLFILKYTLSKIARYVAICKKRPESKKYLYGWICRALEN